MTSGGERQDDGLRNELRQHIEQQLGGITQIVAVGGGCISPAYRVWLSSGRCVFIKLAPAAGPAAMLAEEARSLNVMRSTGLIRVPQVLALGDGWLALEWLEPARATRTDWSQLGAALGRLHHIRGTAFGWEADNFIGTLPQPNAWSQAWPEFWREQRLRPQLERAHVRLDAAVIDDCERLLSQLDALLDAAQADGASLLHGDLWNGNVHMSARGAALIDPASYYGHREVDLAMAVLFGGFAPDFFAAYEAEWPLQPGAEQRRHIYQLYYLLVHVNLFGGGYAAAAAAAIRSALR